MFIWPAISGLSAGWVVGGLTAAAIPVVIHLWARRRAIVMVFPAARFARSAAAGSARRRRLRDWVLMLLRAAALLMLACAFARPLIETPAMSGGTSAGAGVSLVILLDASASMQRSESGASLFDAARERASKVLKGLTPGRDRAAVVLIAEDPRPLLPRLSGNFAELIRTVESAAPTMELGNAAGAMTEARSLFADEPMRGAQVMLVLSDFQSTQWRGVEPWAADDVERRFEPIGRDANAPNIAVSGIEASPARPVAGRPVMLSTMVRNHSDDEVSVLVRFSAAGKRAETMVTLPPRSEREAAISTTFDQVGEAPIEAIIAADGFPFDDAARAEIAVSDAPRYALWSPDDAPIPPTSAGYFIRAALAASASNEPTILGQSELSETALASFDAVAIDGCDGLTAAQVSALRGFATQGGVVLLFGVPGVTTSAEIDDGLWPMTFAAGGSPEPTQVQLGANRWVIDADAGLDEILRAWSGAGITAARSELRPDASAMLESAQGPIVARRTIGGGAAVMFNMELTPSRSPVVRAPLFPALLHAVLEAERSQSRGNVAASSGIDPKESDLRTLADDERRAMETRSGAESHADSERGTAILGGPPLELWPWLLLAALGLLGIEGWFRQRTARPGGVM